MKKAIPYTSYEASILKRDLTLVGKWVWEERLDNDLDRDCYCFCADGFGRQEGREIRGSRTQLWWNTFKWHTLDGYLIIDIEKSSDSMEIGFRNFYRYQIINNVLFFDEECDEPYHKQKC